jgi:hypothetical protein
MTCFCFGYQSVSSELSDVVELSASYVSGHGLPVSSVISHQGMSIVEIDQGCTDTSTTCISNALVSSSLTNVSITVEAGSNKANTITIGTLAAGLDSILGDVTVNGALIPGNCAASLSVVHGSSQVVNGEVTNGAISGIGKPGKSISYAAVCSLTIELGSHDDTLVVTTTHSETTTINTGNGRDSVLIEGTGGVTSINTQDGADSILTSDLPIISSILYLDGGAGSDLYNITFAGQGSSLVFMRDSSVQGVDSDSLIITV